MGVAGLFLVACDPVFDICVTVTDCRTQKPIADALVEIHGEDADKTDSIGQFCISDVGSARNPRDVDVSKSGYQDQSATTSAESDARADAHVCLVPAAPRSVDLSAPKVCPETEDASRFLGGTVYVDDDPGCEGKTPCFSDLTSALAADASATTISLMPGSYDGAELLEGVFWSNLRITGERGPDDTIITGSCISVNGSNGGQIWLDHLTFTGCDASAIAVASSLYLDVRIQDDVFVGPFSGGAVALASSSSDGARVYAAIVRNRFTHQRGDAAAIEGKLHAGDSCIDIESNVLAHNERAFHLTRSAPTDMPPPFRLVGNTFARNDYAVGPKTDLAPFTYTSGARIANNVFFENEYDFSPELELIPRLELHHNLIGSGAFTGLRDNFSADPLFPDADANDYRLLPASPAASAGDPSLVTAPDIEGTARRNPPTLGAYEIDSEPEEDFTGLTCGDGIVQDGSVNAGGATYVGYETCDDGNGDDRDGCTSRCQWEPAGTLGQIAAYQLGVCALRDDGRLKCWGDGTESTPEGPFTQVALKEGGGCGLEPDGALRCWSVSGDDVYAPTGSFTQLAETYDLTCGVSVTGSMTCWDDVEDRLEWAGPFVRVDAGQGVVCALAENGVPTCDPRTQLPPGRLVQTFPGLVSSCALLATGELLCQTSSSTPPKLPQSGFARVSLGAMSCALRPDGRAVSWTDFAAPTTLSDRRFIDIVATAYTCCGLTADRRVYCADTSGGLPQE